MAYWARCPPSRSTATRSPILIASSMSWVTNRIVLRRSRWSLRNSFWSRSRLIGSIAPNGSSISITGGSAASARATPTRWRWPPESWPGKRSRISPGSEISSRSSSTLASILRGIPAQQPRNRGDVLGDRPVREQADLLDHVADLAAELGRLPLAHAGPVDQDVAAGELDHPVDQPHRRGLATAGGPDEHADLTRPDGQRQAVERGLVLARVALGCLAVLDRGGRSVRHAGKLWHPRAAAAARHVRQAADFEFGSVPRRSPRPARRPSPPRSPGRGRPGSRCRRGRGRRSPAGDGPCARSSSTAPRRPSRRRRS